MSRWRFKNSQFSLAGRIESTEEIFKMDTEEHQIPSHPPKLENPHSSDQLVPETDAKSSFRTSPFIRSPSYQLHLLRLSSDSDDCFEAQSPFSPCSMEFAFIEQVHCMGKGPIKEHQTKVRFGSSQFMAVMESVNDYVDEAKSGQQDEERKRLRSDNLNQQFHNSTKYSQLTGQSNAIEQSSGKNTQPSRRNSRSNLKEQSKTESPTTHQNAVLSDFTIPSTSHLALRRKLKSQASQDPSRAKSHEQNAHMRCPLPLKSPKESPVRTTRKINTSTRASKTPRTAPLQSGHFVYPESSRVPRLPTKKTRVGSEKAYKNYTETNTNQERNRKATIPSLPKISQPRQRRQSRDQVSTSSESQSPRRSPRSHAAGLESPSSRCISGRKTSVQDPNAAPSICNIPSTSNLALRSKLKRGMSNPLAAESCEKIRQQKGISTQRPRLLSRPVLSPNRLRCPLYPKSPKMSPKRSPRKSYILATRKINQLSGASKSPRSAMAKHSYFLYPDIQSVPRPPTRRNRLGSSGRFMAPQESQLCSSSNGATQGSFLSLAVSPNRLSCPVPQKPPRKCPVSTAHKNKQSTRAAKTPKSVTFKPEDMHFVYPEIPRGPRPPTRKTRLGSCSTWEKKTSLKDNQTLTPEKYGEAPKQMVSSVPSLPKIPNVQPTKQVLSKKHEKTLLEICNLLSSQKRTV